MSLNLDQISTRLRTMRWQIPGFPKPVNLWGENKGLISVTMMTKLINQSLDEWALELKIDKNDWILDDGAGGEGTLVVDQRRYLLPNDLLVATEARVAYDDSTGFTGYPLIVVNERFLDSALTDINVTNTLTNTTEPVTDRPERIFVWQDEFWLDPIPDDTYTLRLWGYHLPDTLSTGTDSPDPMGIYHESIFLKAKELVARELGVANQGVIIAESKRLARTVKDFDKERHDSVKIVEPGAGGYWD